MFTSRTTDDVKLRICIVCVIEPFSASAFLIIQSTALHKVITLRLDNEPRFFLSISLATV